MSEAVKRLQPNNEDDDEASTDRLQKVYVKTNQWPNWFPQLVWVPVALVFDNAEASPSSLILVNIAREFWMETPCSPPVRKDLRRSSTVWRAKNFPDETIAAKFKLYDRPSNCEGLIAVKFDLPIRDKLKPETITILLFEDDLSKQVKDVTEVNKVDQRVSQIRFNNLAFAYRNKTPRVVPRPKEFFVWRCSTPHRMRGNPKFMTPHH